MNFVSIFKSVKSNLLALSKKIEFLLADTVSFGVPKGFLWWNNFIVQLSVRRWSHVLDWSVKRISRFVFDNWQYFWFEFKNFWENFDDIFLIVVCFRWCFFHCFSTQTVRRFEPVLYFVEILNSACLSKLSVNLVLFLR